MENQNDALDAFRGECKELIDKLGIDDLEVLRDEVKRIIDEHRESRDDIVLSLTKNEFAMIKTALSMYISDYGFWLGEGVEPYQEMLRYMESFKDEST